MPTRYLIPSVAFALVASGCAERQDLGVHSAAAPPPAVAVFQDIPQAAVDLGAVTTTSCLNRIWDARPGWELALDDLKRAAAGMGANAVAHVVSEEGNVFFCPSSLKLTARALQASQASLDALAVAPASSRRCGSDDDSLSDFLTCKLDGPV